MPVRAVEVAKEEPIEEEEELELQWEVESHSGDDW